MPNEFVVFRDNIFMAAKLIGVSYQDMLLELVKVFPEGLRVRAGSGRAHMYKPDLCLVSYAQK